MEKKDLPAFSDDWYRMTGRKWESEKLRQKVFTFLNSHALRYLYTYRKVQRQEDPLGIFRLILRLGKRNYGLEISSPYIGKGLYLGHPYNISVCRNARIGSCCNLNKGASIVALPSENGEAAPVIGNRVWIGVNAVIRGNVRVGDNVLIAPNAIVDRDIPSDSVVIGVPCQIHTGRPDAVEGYINHVC